MLYMKLICNLEPIAERVVDFLFKKSNADGHVVFTAFDYARVCGYNPQCPDDDMLDIIDYILECRVEIDGVKQPIIKTYKWCDDKCKIELNTKIIEQ